MPDYWRPAGLIVLFLVAATLATFVPGRVAKSAERSRALAMVALSFDTVRPSAVGVFTFVLGPGGGVSEPVHHDGRPSLLCTSTSPGLLWLSRSPDGSCPRCYSLWGLWSQFPTISGSKPGNADVQRHEIYSGRFRAAHEVAFLPSQWSMRRAWPERVTTDRDVIDPELQDAQGSPGRPLWRSWGRPKEIIGHLDSPSDDQTVTGILPVVGWITDPTGPGAVIEVTVNDRTLDNPIEKVSRSDVEVALPSNSGRRVVTGFRATFDTSQFPDGAHRFSCVVRKFGEEKVIASRTIQTRNGRANLCRKPRTLRKAVQ